MVNRVTAGLSIWGHSCLSFYGCHFLNAANTDVVTVLNLSEVAEVKSNTFSN